MLTYTAAIVAAAVNLSDAPTPPDFTAKLRPGGAVAVDRQCARDSRFSDVNAYRSNGAALSGQRWTADRTLTYWRGRHGRVTYDRSTFRNGTRAAVIVAGWCEDDS